MFTLTGESSRLSELCRPLLVASIRHDIPGLARAAQYSMVASLTPENASDMLYLSHKYGAPLLKEEVLKYSVQYAKEVTSRNEWTNLSLKYPEILVEFTKRLAATT